jgi:hypothetical protein
VNQPSETFSQKFNQKENFEKVTRPIRGNHVEREALAAVSSFLFLFSILLTFQISSSFDTQAGK